MITQPTFIVIMSYSVLFATLLLPQSQESKAQYTDKIKPLLLFFVPSIVSVLTIHCMSKSCPDLARINAYIIMIWCLCTAYIFVFRKLI
jgi:putative effector of murein hydrolase LrgA (UPF0299 family)